ncbi:peptidase inhibitor family I36 protein [Streptomyces sp. NPDC051662]|uniref:peptidase inhibitor family I36 protein n=1 Tax=Streptomyces sp. NPDC051662 TaxID=3154750 RepID=UPI003447F6CA
MRHAIRSYLRPLASLRSRGGSFRTLMVTAAALLLLGGTVSSAGADSNGVQSPRSGYCLQTVGGSARCYDSKAAALDTLGAAPGAEHSTLSPMSLGDCASGRFCIWEWTDYNSNGLWRWRIGAGTWQLQEGDMMNQGSSAYNARSGLVVLIDSACPEWVLAFEPGDRAPDFSKIPRPAPCGGTWNNRVDKIELY